MGHFQSMTGLVGYSYCGGKQQQAAVQSTGKAQNPVINRDPRHDHTEKYLARNKGSELVYIVSS